MKNTINRGSEAELIFATECAKRQMTVCFPINHASQYDLIVDAGEPRRIQVKRAYPVNNHGSIALCVETRRILVKHSGKKGSVARQYDKNGFDYLVACNLDSGDFWFINIETVLAYKAQIYLGKKFDYCKNQWILLGGVANQQSEKIV